MYTLLYRLGAPGWGRETAETIFGLGHSENLILFVISLDGPPGVTAVIL